MAYSDNIDTRFLDRPNGAQTTSSSTPATSVGIVTELLWLTRNHVKASRPQEADIDERVNIIECVEC